MPQFSVIIPLYNKEKSIIGTIQSVIKQTYKDFEIIVVDDGSTDQSLAYVKGILDPRLTYYEKKNGGVSTARNFGIKKAKGDYIAFLDADDFWDSQYLEKIAETISNQKDALVVASGFRLITDNSSTPITVSNTQRLIKIDNIMEYYSKSKWILNSSSICIHRNVFDNVGLFNEKEVLGEDLEMWIKISLKFDIYYIDSTLSNYCLDAMNRTMKRCYPKKEYSHMEYLRQIQPFIDKRKRRYLKKYLSSQTLNIALINLVRGNRKNALKLVSFSKCKYHFGKLLKFMLLILLPYRIVRFLLKLTNDNYA